MSDRSREIIGAAIEVHTAIGPGLLESAYQQCLERELALRGIPFVRQMPLSLDYKGVAVDVAYRLDFLVEDTVVEIKSVDAINPIHIAQLMTYMKVGHWPLGLLINFNVTALTRGIRRIAL